MNELHNGHQTEHAARGQDLGHGEHEAHKEHGHGGHAGHGDHIAQYRRLFWWTLLLAVPVVGLSPMAADLLGYSVPGSGWTTWVPAVLGTVAFAVGGRPFLTGAVGELRARQPGMMTLIALAITVAFAASLATSLGLFGLHLDFWWELALLLVVMLLGHWLEMRALGTASGALDALSALLPDTAEVVDDSGRPTLVALSQLRTGDVVLVRPGGRVPADAEVVSGSAHVDESMITGESRPVRRGPGDRVVAGTVATDDALRARVTATGEATALAGIQRLVAEAQGSSSRAQLLADRAAAWLFWFALGVAAVTAVVWLALGQPDDALVRAVTVLVIACPHALGLAIPLVVAISTERAARSGVLVTDRFALERMRTVDTVLFDKTGTLTTGSATVTGFAAAPGQDAQRVVAMAAAVEADSQHPLATAVVAYAGAQGVTPPPADELASLTGRGVRGTVDRSTVAVGGPRLLRDERASVPESLAASYDEWSGRGATVVSVLVDGAVAGAFAVEDGVRPESAEAVRLLHDRDVRVALVTGDARPVAEAVGAAVGVDQVFAEVLPQDKDSVVRSLQGEGRRVAMVGDGVNDAPALARADVGVAIGAGTDVAIESAGVVLARSDPRGVVSVIELSRATYRKMVQNLVWATGYNLVAVPLAAGLLAPWGVSISPAVAALLMAASTVVVAANAVLLRRLRLTTDTQIAPARAD